MWPNIYVGNFIAASQAERLGIDAVLNLATELMLAYSPKSGIAYKKLGTLEGAKKLDIYPHRNLKRSLEQLFPR